MYSQWSEKEIKFSCVNLKNRRRMSNSSFDEGERRFVFVILTVLPRCVTPARKMLGSSSKK